MSVTPILAIAAALVAWAPPSAGESRGDRWIERLSTANPETRRAAVDELAALPTVAADLVPFLLDEARAELTAALQPAPPSNHGTPTGRIPLVGDEVSLERVKANAPEYIDKSFVLCGAIRLSDHYNYGYWDAEKTHFAFRFSPIKVHEGQTASEGAVLYLLRQRGRRLAEQIVSLAEHGVEQAIVRVRVTIAGYRHKAPETWRYMELVDWQLLNPDRDAWDPWAFAGFDHCFAAIERAGNGAVRPLVDLIATPPDNEVVSADMDAAAVRTLAAAVIARAVDFDQVNDAMRAAQRDTDDIEARQRLIVALATIDQRVRDARTPAAAILKH
jgi:hypothetical protein